MEIAQKIRYRFSIKPGWDASWRRDDFTLWRDSYLPIYEISPTEYVNLCKRNTTQSTNYVWFYNWTASEGAKVNHFNAYKSIYNIQETINCQDILTVNFDEPLKDEFLSRSNFNKAVYSYGESTICNDYGYAGYEIVHITNNNVPTSTITIFCFDSTDNLLDTYNRTWSYSSGLKGISNFGGCFYNPNTECNHNVIVDAIYLFYGNRLYRSNISEAVTIKRSTSQVEQRAVQFSPAVNVTAFTVVIDETNDSHILRHYFPFPEPDKYTLRVINGTGTGNYAENETAVITANAQSGKTFLRWSFSPYAPTFVTGNEYTAGCSFKMPATNLVCTAEYTGQPTPSGGGDPYIPNPYNPPGSGGPSDSLPSDGTYDFTSVDIPIPNIPSITYSNTGFISAYKPTTSDLQNLSSYLWSDAFNIDNLKKLILNPYEAIYGLSIVPTYNNYPLSSPSTVAIGNLSTGLSMQKITSQYYSLDCGSVNIDAKWGNYFDYSPYNKIQLYLPYIGFVDLTADDCVRGPVSVTYHVDVLGGICVAYVKCGEHVLYTYAGQCSTPCPISQGQYQNIFISALKAGGAIAGAAISPSFGSVSGAVGSVADAAVSTIKPEISRGGSFGGSGGLMSIQYPYIVRTVPRLCIPANQNTYIGYPSFVSLPLSTLSGYTRIHEIHLHDIGATTPELNEIENLLKAGVIL